jgi:magnesium chelatase family protein
MRDRLDLWVRAEPPHTRGWDGAEPSERVAARVASAWEVQRARQGQLNGELLGPRADAAPGLGRTVASLLAKRTEQLRLSPRRTHRSLRVARTIADLAASELVEGVHLDEALHYRPEAAP